MISEDPARAGLNWYIYAENNPLFYIDPFGLDIVAARAYAESFGATVTWTGNYTLNGVTYANATVYYHDKSLKITGKLENGCLMIDDSVLNNRFGWRSPWVPSIEQEYLKEDWAFNVGLGVVGLTGSYSMLIAGEGIAASSATGLIGAGTGASITISQVAQPTIAVIGSHPEYIVKAQQIGARFFQVPPHIWDKMTPAAQRAANIQFLDRAIAEGAHFIIESSKAVTNYEPGLRMEIEYLLNAGYMWANNRTMLIPGI